MPRRCRLRSPAEPAAPLWRISLASFWEVIPHFIIKAATGTGLTKESPDASFRTCFVWFF